MRRVLTFATGAAFALSLLILQVGPAFAQSAEFTSGNNEPVLDIVDVEDKVIDRTDPGPRTIIPPPRNRTPRSPNTLGAPPAELARTGMGVSVGAALALGLTVAGGATLLLARRRDRSAS